MKICFPVERNEGLESIVYGHFGSAPALVVVDGTTGLVTTIAESAADAPGGCQPIKALAEHPVTAAVVAGIGGGALSRLALAGIDVYRATEPTIEDNLHLLKRGALPRWDAAADCGCSGHGHDHGHHHGPGGHHHHHHHGGGCGCKH